MRRTRSRPHDEASMAPVLVTGATGRVGRVVVDQLLGAACRCARSRADRRTAGLPAAVEVVSGDLTVPESLDAGLQGVGAVFLVWTAPSTTAPAVVERSPPMRSASSFSPRRIERRTRSSSNRIRWRSSTPTSSA